eukprot:COSAG01_NODE_7395_length_3224_cov_4.919360_6_plen_234_part_01
MCRARRRDHDSDRPPPLVCLDLQTIFPASTSNTVNKLASALICCAIWATVCAIFVLAQGDAEGVDQCEPIGGSQSSIDCETGFLSEFELMRLQDTSNPSQSFAAKQDYCDRLDPGGGEWCAARPLRAAPSRRSLPCVICCGAPMSIEDRARVGVLLPCATTACTRTRQLCMHARAPSEPRACPPPLPAHWAGGALVAARRVSALPQACTGWPSCRDACCDPLPPSSDEHKAGHR